MLESLIRLAQGTTSSLTFIIYQITTNYEKKLLLMVLWCHTAHARLMFRNEVTRLDAITAILCIESSMTISAIVDSMGNALHSNFSEEPDQECILFRNFLTFVSIYVCSLTVMVWNS